MSDRPAAINGKRNQAWGTLHACPACGQCLCFGCHPTGPCVDDAALADGVASGSHPASAFTATGFPVTMTGAWLAGGASGSTGVPGLRMHAASDAAHDRLR